MKIRHYEILTGSSCYALTWANNNLQKDKRFSLIAQALLCLVTFGAAMSAAADLPYISTEGDKIYISDPDKVLDSRALLKSCDTYEVCRDLPCNKYDEPANDASVQYLKLHCPRSASGTEVWCSLLRYSDKPTYTSLLVFSENSKINSPVFRLDPNPNGAAIHVRAKLKGSAQTGYSLEILSIGDPSRVALFFRALTLTILIEIAAAYLLTLTTTLRRSVLKDVLIINCCTVPLLWHLVPYFTDSIVVGELLVFMIEASWYWRRSQLTLRKSLLLSFFLNALSLAAGFLLSM